MDALLALSEGANRSLIALASSTTTGASATPGPGTVRFTWTPDGGAFARLRCRKSASLDDRRQTAIGSVEETSRTGPCLMRS